MIKLLCMVGDKVILNRKGYMLVEIILASVIAFGIAYFILDMTIKLKNKNDDLLVETQVMTDKTIINNKLMKYAIDKGQEFDCSKLAVEGNTISYDGDTIDILNGYTNIEYNSNNCKVDIDKATISVHIGLDVPQMADKNFDINLNYRYRIIDNEAPTCELLADANKVSFSKKEDNESVIAFDIIKTGDIVDYDNTSSLSIAVDTFTGYVKDLVGNEGTCSITIDNTKKVTYVSNTKEYDDCSSGQPSSWGLCYCVSCCQQVSPCVNGCKSDGGACYVSMGHNLDDCKNKSNGWKKRNGHCEKDATRYDCSSDEYTKINDNYCYKIND